MIGPCFILLDACCDDCCSFVSLMKENLLGFVDVEVSKNMC